MRLSYIYRVCLSSVTKFQHTIVIIEINIKKCLTPIISFIFVYHSFKTNYRHSMIVDFDFLTVALQIENLYEQPAQSKHENSALQFLVPEKKSLIN